jgi:MFS family permease
MRDMNRRVLLWSVTSALAGFLFGFDTVVISGAEKTIQWLWGLSAGMHGIAVGAALYGTVLGALLGGWPTDRFGRKATLLWIGVFYLVGALGSALAPDVYSFIIVRVIGGIGIGVSTVVAPLYISEIAPPKYRGRLAGMFQFNIVFGILVAFLSNWILGEIGSNRPTTFSGNDIKDLPGFVTKLRQQSDPVSAFLWQKFSNPEQATLTNYQPSATSSTEAQDVVVQALNRVIAGPAIYETNRFKDIPLRPATSDYLKEDSKVAATGPDLARQNRMLIEDAYRTEIVRIGGNIWRWMVGVAAFPSLVFTLLCFGLPESPRWLLVRKGNREEGLKVLRLIEPDAPQSQIESDADAIAAASTEQAGAGHFWSWRLRIPILLAFFIAFFNQLSGINAILYYAPRIFEMAGLTEKAALLQTVGIGVTNFIFTFVGLYLIDRLGRRTLLYIGSFGYIISLSLVACAFFTQHYSIVPVCIFAFIAAHAVGQGAVIWVFIAEIFPNRHRAEGQALGCGTHWVFCALLASFFPKMADIFKDQPGYIFLFFAFMMVLQLVWVATMVPETKGVPLEQMQKRLGVEPG